MTGTRNHYDTISTIQNQEQEQQEKEQGLRSSSGAAGSSSSAASSTATGARACAYARETEARAAMLRGQYVDCCEYYAASFHRGIPAGIQREIATRIKQGMTADVIRAAIDDTMLAPRPSWAYCAAILKNCDLDGVKTLSDWNERKARRAREKNPALNYEQRTYTADDFGEDFFIDLEKY